MRSNSSREPQPPNLTSQAARVLFTVDQVSGEIEVLERIEELVILRWVFGALENVPADSKSYRLGASSESNE